MFLITEEQMSPSQRKAAQNYAALEAGICHGKVFAANIIANYPDGFDDTNPILTQRDDSFRAANQTQKSNGKSVSERENFQTGAEIGFRTRLIDHADYLRNQNSLLEAAEVGK